MGCPRSELYSKGRQGCCDWGTRYWVFNKVLETNPLVTSLLFVDDLGFIALGGSVKKVVKIFEKVAQAVLE